MIIFGGFVRGVRTSEMYRYYFKENRWEYVEYQGRKQPPKRAGHSMVVLNDSLFVFGGKDEDNYKLNDLWEFNLTTNIWQ